MLNFVYMKDVHIGKHIHTVFISKGLTVTEFAKRINKSRENIYHVFNRKSIDTDLLLKISEILEYDFFTLYISDSNDKKEINSIIERNKPAIKTKIYVNNIESIEDFEKVKLLIE